MDYEYKPNSSCYIAHGDFKTDQQYKIKDTNEVVTLYRYMGEGVWSISEGIETVLEEYLVPIKKNVMSAIRTIHGKKEMLRVQIEELNKEMQELEIAEKVLHKLV